MKKFLLTLVLVLSMSSSALWATDGNELYQWGQAWVRFNDNRARDGDLPDSWRYITYVLAVLDVYTWQGVIKIPENTTKGQLLDIVFKYLSDHPADRQYGGISLVLNALSTTYGAGRNWKKFVEMVE